MNYEAARRSPYAWRPREACLRGGRRKQIAPEIIFSEKNTFKVEACTSRNRLFAY